MFVFNRQQGARNNRNRANERQNNQNIIKIKTRPKLEIKNIIIEGVNLETQYNKDLFPRGILGLNSDYVNQYVQYVADRRMEELGFAPHYNVTNPAKWMSTATDVYELVNFFEAQNTNYEVNAKAHNNPTEKPKA